MASKRQIGTILGRVVAVFASLLGSFFGVFNVLFSDVFGVRAMLGAIGYVMVLYAAVGFLGRLAWRGAERTWRLWLFTPAGAIAILLTFAEPGRGWYHGGVFLAAALGTLIGSMRPARLWR